MERAPVTALICGSIVQLLAANAALGANPAVRPEEAEFWNGAAFVVAARVIAVNKAEQGSEVYFKVELEPLVCVAGLFNPASQPRMTVDLAVWAEQPTKPTPGDLILGVIYDRTKLGVPKQGWGFANGRCTFMPDQRQLIVLKGLDDERILNVLQKIRGARPPSTLPAANKAEQN